MANDDAAWDDPSWIEQSDTAWRRRLRRHQGWWRATQTPHDPGCIARREGPVVSMLPEDVDLDTNLLTKEAIEALDRATARPHGPGIVSDLKVRRNLLSSQPLCFNLFGHLGADPDSLLPWVRSLDAAAVSVTGVELEIAPVADPLGGSAFDAFVTYRTTTDVAFLGIECKYAEHLPDGARKPASEKYHRATTSPPWEPDAATVLDQPALRQFWYNTLLLQRVCTEGRYGRGTGVVVACAEDAAAVRATEAVASQLRDPSALVFSSIEDVVEGAVASVEWKAMFRTRYLDFDASGSR